MGLTIKKKRKIIYYNFFVDIKMTYLLLTSNTNINAGISTKPDRKKLIYRSPERFFRLKLIP